MGGPWALGARPGGSPAQSVSPPRSTTPDLSCTSPSVIPALEGAWHLTHSTPVHVPTLPWKEDSVAEHQGQGGGCPVHVPRLHATARGECRRPSGRLWLLTGVITRSRPLAFAYPSWLPDGTFGVAAHLTLGGGVA